MTLAEGRKFLYDIIDSIAFTIMPELLREICKSNQEVFLEVKSNLSSSTSLDSALETSPKPGTSEGEEIHPSKFSSRFEDESTGNHRNTLNLIDAQSGKEPSSVHTDQSRALLTEPSLRSTVPPSPPDARNEAPLEEAMKDEWLDGEKCFSEAIWISSL